MKKSEKVLRLSRLAQMVLDRDLAQLAAAAKAKAASEANLADLAKPQDTSGLAPVAAHHAELRWQKWADARRIEINIQLARQTADWLNARQSAQTAFARNTALRGIAAKPDQPS